ncbi:MULTISPECIES: GAF domain-containing SpoIIE family protein phosphatase [Streptomyces]|uniref:PPM-type phosphatase domain-containing protein n=1 Tax=Streptomyces mordarskii TaxID=1226758 RepID=A0ABN1CG31_9ACTN|nr:MULTISPECIES: PP2C family protein-serine/threonine phosphatase [Streptomyces]QTI88892.1 serine/threonine-protein phosphatase [Streptomyces sp. AgN23]WTB06810.1 serine/threonine-protein phosphatase [Streptomyces antimycoticus]
MNSPHAPKVAGIDPSLPSPTQTADPVPDPVPPPLIDANSGVQDRLASWVSDLTTLHELTERLVRTGTLDEALRELLRAGAALVGARRGLVALEPADGLGPVTTVGLGLGHADLGQIETIPRGSASAGHLLDGLPEPGGERRADVTHPDIAGEADLDPRHREVAARLGFAASYAVPLDPFRTTPCTAPGLTAIPAPAPDADGSGTGSPAGAGDRPALGTPGTASAPGTGHGRDAAPAAAAPPGIGAAMGAGGPSGRLGGAAWLYDEPAEPGERQRHLVGLYCQYAAAHIARLLELSRARAAVATVQEELLPTRLPRVPGVRLAVRHHPGPHGGGDWYDALPLPDGALGLSVGGVTGSGPSAVVAMGRLRASLRAYAVMEGEDPVAVLSDLELLLRLTEPARSATALFAYCEPGTRKVVLAGAGHCPPLLTGERRTEFVETTLSAPLGMLSCWEAPSVEIEPSSGETLLFYSDGLLHRTGEPMDRAFTRLHTAAASAPKGVRGDPDAFADHVLRTVLPDGPAAPVGRPSEDGTEDLVLLVAHFD